MKKHTILFTAFFLTIILGCNSSREFSEAKNLSVYQKTEFLPTLEHKIDSSKNSIYCVPLLYAWDEIRKQINQPLEIPEENFDLNLLNASKSFIDVLKSDEYIASGTVDGEIIKARAEFSKSLPFDIKLQSYEGKLVFDGQPVASFGVQGYNDYEQLKTVQILYYKDDNNFIISLLLKDKEHEVILIKSEKAFNLMSDMTDEVVRLSETGKAERKCLEKTWKYSLSEEDEVVIPKFNFNIETNYQKLEGNKFKTHKQNYSIQKVWQRTAFVLDETGAEVESEAEIEVVTEAVEEDYEKPKPKKIIFDKPFLVLLKRTDAENPYFGLWATNTELMIKE